MELKVSNNSNVNAVAGAIVGNLNDGKEVELTAVGAGAVNQTVKSIAVARGFTIPSGIDLVVSISFKTIDIDGADVSAMSFKIIKEER